MTKSEKWQLRQQRLEAAKKWKQSLTPQIESAKEQLEEAELYKRYVSEVMRCDTLDCDRTIGALKEKLRGLDAQLKAAQRDIDYVDVVDDNELDEVVNAGGVQYPAYNISGKPCEGIYII